MNESIDRLMPQDEGAERALVGAMLNSPTLIGAACAARGITGEEMFNHACRIIMIRAMGMWRDGKPIDPITVTSELSNRGELEGVGGAPNVFDLATKAYGVAANHAAYIDSIMEKAKLRGGIEMCTRFAEAAWTDQIRDVSGMMTSFSAGVAALAAKGMESDRTGLNAVLQARRFDATNPPPAVIPRFKLGEAVICTPGNISGMQAQAKAGKTAFLGAIIAATMEPTGDCLGVTAENPEGLAVIHFDTEQAPADHHRVIAGALKRAGRITAPPWLHSYRIADIDFLTRRQSIAHEIERVEKLHGGVFCVLLDGLADFIADPNDSAECFAFIDELHRLAIRFATSIVCIIHENPSSDTGKSRGHLGSQLERKAESNLRLAKDGDGITTVFSERSRQAHIPKEQGPRFEWSDKEKMHVSTEAKPKGRPKAFEDEEILDLIGKGWVTPTAALELCKADNWKPSTFKLAWRRLKASGQIIQSGLDRGLWGAKK